MAQLVITDIFAVPYFSRKGDAQFLCIEGDYVKLLTGTPLQSQNRHINHTQRNGTVYLLSKMGNDTT